MEFHEETKSSIELEDQPDDSKILTLPRNPVMDRSPTSIAKGTLSKADRIRGVTRSLVVDALVVLDNMWDDCKQSPTLKEDYYLLHHYLDYIKRFCEGRA